MATSNLFIVLSLFEVYVLRLAAICRDATGVGWDRVRGQGVGRLLAYLRSLGVSTGEPILWPQISAALKIRHSLMHASGFLLHSREERELRRIIQSKTYLSVDHRQADRDAPLVFVFETPAGDQLKIKNQYAWLLATYVRDYLSALGGLVAGVLVESPS